jgi:hypothetical protein
MTRSIVRLPLLASVVVLCCPGNAGAQQKVSDWLADQGLPAFKNYTECMAATNGHLESLFADRLEAKLGVSNALKPEEREVWQADLDALRAVANEHHAYRAPDAKHPDQYLDAFTDDEFRAIHSMNTRFGQDLQLACEDKYGDMAYTKKNGKSDSQKQYEAQLRSKLIEPTDVKTIPLGALPSPFPKQQPSAAEQLAATTAASKASMASSQAAVGRITDCTKGITSLRWKLMADKMQERLDAGAGLSAQQKTDLAADIGATRRAAEQGLAQPEAVDTANPYRFMTWLSADDQAAVTSQYTTQLTAMMASCTQR